MRAKISATEAAGSDVHASVAPGPKWKVDHIIHTLPGAGFKGP
jgi:hypothetical protein